MTVKQNDYVHPTQNKKVRAALKRTELQNQDTIKECIQLARQNIAARSREYLQYRASKYMGFLKCIELARQNIAAQSREYLQYRASKYTYGHLDYVKSEVCRWENAVKLGGHFVYVGDTAPRHVLFEGDSSESEEEGMHCMQCRHGYGICIWDEAGARYKGCWKCDGRSGLGLMIYPDGTVVEGEWMGGDLMNNRATLWLRDGARCFEGYDWLSSGIPTDALGGAWRVKNKQCDWDDQSRKTFEKYLNGNWCDPDDKEVPSP